MKTPTSTPDAPVNVHKNAKLTPVGRAQMIERLEAGQAAANVAASVGVSKTTVSKWWKRWKAGRETGLEDRLPRPH